MVSNYNVDKDGTWFAHTPSDECARTVGRNNIVIVQDGVSRFPNYSTYYALF